MNLIIAFKPTLRDLARALFSTELRHGASLPSPSCDDCQLPAVLRAELPDARLGRLVRVHQCPNCAKVLWGDE
jgi:hypothetical protein